MLFETDRTTTFVLPIDNRQIRSRLPFPLSLRNILREYKLFCCYCASCVGFYNHQINATPIIPRHSLSLDQHRDSGKLSSQRNVMRRSKQDRDKVLLLHKFTEFALCCFQFDRLREFCGQTYQALIYGRLNEGSQLTLLLSYQRENVQCGEACATGLLSPHRFRRPSYHPLLVVRFCSAVV